ncbi:tRNA pseudouridine(55) synthase TruB [Anaeromyxobacter soli]|uniref:tRNA pseudouridine(55) synthase TruB n=1 Tax=Anaeromyxobacter soli TaxID=2922725 RepID=UPI001FAEC60D|nr:tRNA pseudouridine(55) synthase TruB [Anaeromyxobacter sp. SG29]
MSRSGVLVVDKPAGPTSFDVVQRVRRLLGAARAGHAGTLDPAATGVLAVCVGDAVKLQQYLADADKAYEATVEFGAATETEDAEGRVIETGDPSGLDADRIRAALARFVGEIEQVPPMYSAVRVRGRRLHEAARAGESVERVPRRVRVDALELLALDAPGEPGEPETPPAEGGPGPRVRLARLAVRCGKGTYVRTLAADLGRALGVPAHLAALRRTEASAFRVEEGIALAEAEALGRDALASRIIPMGDALRVVPPVAVDWHEARDLVHGRALERDAPAPLVRALAPDGRLVAICSLGERGLRPQRVFLGPGDLGAARAEER